VDECESLRPAARETDSYAHSDARSPSDYSQSCVKARLRSVEHIRYIEHASDKEPVRHRLGR